MRVSLRLMKAAIEWAEARAAEGLQKGRGLTEEEMKIARDMGVTHPELIRLMVGQIPMPTGSLLKAAMARIGIGEEIDGLTLGYAVHLNGEPSGPTDLVLVHEYRHCYQWEQMDGLASFVTEFMRQFSQFGYQLAPWEIDARNAAWGLVNELKQPKRTNLPSIEEKQSVREERLRTLSNKQQGVKNDR